MWEGPLSPDNVRECEDCRGTKAPPTLARHQGSDRAPRGASIHPDVGILRFVAQLGRKLFVAAVAVTMMARQNRTVSSVIGWEGEAEHFPKPGVKPHVSAADPPNHAITERRGIAFAL